MVTNALWTSATYAGARSTAGRQGVSIIASIAIGLFLIGYSGTERLWYKPCWERRDFTVQDVWFASWGYLRRFFGVAFVGSIALSPLFIFDAFLRNSSLEPGSFPIGSTVAFVVGDVLATFITPALAFTNTSGDRAIPLGLRVLRRTWPSSAPYVLFPPLALVMLGRVGFPGLTLAAQLILVTLSALVALLAKGATAAYYLRLQLTPEEGAEPA